MNALVTGVNGFCGRPLAQRLLAEGMSVHGVDLQTSADNRLTLASYNSADLSASDTIRTVIREVQPDWVFHLAGLTVGDPKKIFEVNTIGTVNLLEGLRENAPKARLLVVGSAAEYGEPNPPDALVAETHPCDPKGPYGISKYAATIATFDYVRRFGMHAIVVRPFNIIGPGVPGSLLLGAILSRTLAALERPEEPVITAGNLETYRDFVSVQDIVDAYLLAIQSGTPGELYNVCSGQPTKMRDLVDLALSHAPRPVRVEIDPALIRPNDIMKFVGDGSKARDSFGFVPSVSLESAVAEAWTYAASQPRPLASTPTK